jgi:lactoylglutathione lyase
MLRAMGTAVEPLVRTVSVVYLYVSDMERSLAFYRDLLGIPLAGDSDWQEATLGGTRFALHKTHKGIGLPSSGTIHVSLGVADIDAAVERVRAERVEVKETMRDEWGVAVQVIDPDGYEIYLFQPPS